MNDPKAPAVGDKVYTYGHRLPDGTGVAVALTVTKTTKTGFTTDDGRRWINPPSWAGRTENMSYKQWAGRGYSYAERPEGIQTLTSAEYRAAKEAAFDEKVAAADAARKAKIDELGVANFIRALIRDGGTATTAELRKLRELVGDDEVFITELVNALGEQASFRRYVKNAVANLSRLVAEGF